MTAAQESGDVCGQQLASQPSDSCHRTRQQPAMQTEYGYHRVGDGCAFQRVRWFLTTFQGTATDLSFGGTTVIPAWHSSAPLGNGLVWMHYTNEAILKLLCTCALHNTYINCASKLFIILPSPRSILTSSSDWPLSCCCPVSIAINSFAILAVCGTLLGNC